MHLQRQRTSSFGIDDYTPNDQPLSGKYLKSPAYIKIKDRIPETLASVVDLLWRNRNELTNCQNEAEEDLKVCIGKITKLRNEVQTNKSFIEMTGGGDDVDDWNDYLKNQQGGSDSVNWFQSPWMYTEGYLYRRLYDIFRESKVVKNYDYFARKKEDAFRSDLTHIKRLSEAFRSMLELWSDSEESIFRTLTRIAVWSNHRRVTDSQPTLPISDDKDFLLHDDSDKIHQFLADQTSPDTVVVDYVLDEAGLDLVADLCLCDFLCTSRRVARIRFRVRRVPWCVSQITAVDLKWTIGVLSTTSGTEELGHRWNRYLASGIWTVHEDKFWTTPQSLTDLEKVDPRLGEDLQSSAAIILKGDMNYRRIMGDIKRRYSTALEVAVDPSLRLRDVILLRKIRSEVLVGISKEKCAGIPATLDWDTDCDYGVVQFKPRAGK